MVQVCGVPSYSSRSNCEMNVALSFTFAKLKAYKTTDPPNRLFEPPSNKGLQPSFYQCGGSFVCGSDGSWLRCLSLQGFPLLLPSWDSNARSLVGRSGVVEETGSRPEAEEGIKGGQKQKKGSKVGCWLVGGPCPPDYLLSTKEIYAVKFFHSFALHLDSWSALPIEWNLPKVTTYGLIQSGLNRGVAFGDRCLLIATMSQCGCIRNNAAT